MPRKKDTVMASFFAAIENKNGRLSVELFPSLGGLDEKLF